VNTQPRRQVGDAAIQRAFQCRHCNAPLTLVLADLGSSPVGNDYVEPSRANAMQPYYPLKVFVCGDCRLAQTMDLLPHDALFREDYAYFSSHSTSWLDHARTYVSSFVERFHIGEDSQVVELASNDGYLLQFVKGSAYRVSE